jgi:hypothetical protein
MRPVRGRSVLFSREAQKKVNGLVLVEHSLNLQKIIEELFPSDGVFCVLFFFWCFFWHATQKMLKCANAQIAVPA